jgi:hypothetical protein
VVVVEKMNFLDDPIAAGSEDLIGGLLESDVDLLCLCKILG